MASVAMNTTLTLPVYLEIKNPGATKLTANARLLASQFEIRGEILLMNETVDRPTNEYKTLGSKNYQIKPASLDSAMKQAEQKLNQLLQKQSESVLDFKNLVESESAFFIPEEICVMDEYGAIIGLFIDGVWRMPIAKCVWSFMTDQAIKSRDEATEEAGKLNFVDSQVLRQYAKKLDEMVAMSINHRTGRIVREVLL